jgi:rRNA maturation endonuclease Nob1
MFCVGNTAKLLELNAKNIVIRRKIEDVIIEVIQYNPEAYSSLQLKIKKIR